MNSQKLDSLQTELAAALDALAPELEGFQDLDALDISPASNAQVGEDIAAALRRQLLLTNAVGALTALTSDGYPEVKVMEVNPKIYDDLAEQSRTITAALARYKKGPGEAVGGEVTIR